MLVHVEPRGLFCLNKTCRFCTSCDFIIVKQSELESFLHAVCKERAPEIVGNEYFVYGTMDRRDWRIGQRGELTEREAIDRAHPFKGMPESTEGRPWGQPLKKLEGAPLNLG